jgi:carbonic anhydrase/acetyltransferase-like protein (isoleucine patch superfamily)
MKKIIIRNKNKIAPFNEPARNLRVLNKPLWLYQSDVLSRHCAREIEVESLEQIALDDEGSLIYRDNLFFDGPFIDAFLDQARARDKVSRVAFSLDDKTIVSHALPLQDDIHREDDVYVTSMWYVPARLGSAKRRPVAVSALLEQAQPLVIDTQAEEKGYYHIPTYMADDKGELLFWVPLRAFLSIENWVHVFMANSPLGIFSWGARMERDVDKWGVKAKIVLRSLLERKQFLSCSELVKVGKNTQIDPTAIIQGPTLIGDNVTIGPGVVISNCIIGNNVNIMQGCQLLLSVISDGCYLPFRAALFMTTLMENSMVAQNTCLQLCVVGRNSFIGAGTTFTDFNLLPRPLRTLHKGHLELAQRPVLGGCVGHNCRIGAGLTIYPARTIESDTVLVRSDRRAVIAKNVSYEESDHHDWENEEQHPRQYPR